MNSKLWRTELFKHLDGIVTAPVAYCLNKNNVLSHLLEINSMSIPAMAELFNANEGYLNIACRTLASQGWLDYKVENLTKEVTVTLNENSKIAFELTDKFKDVFELIQFSEKFHPRKFELQPFLKLESIFQKYYDSYGLTVDLKTQKGKLEAQVLKLIEGILVGPTIVILGMGGMFHQYFMKASFSADEYHKDPENFTKILDFLCFLGWFDKKDKNYRFTEKGLFFAKRASAYGVTTSYIPTFRKLDELIFGDAKYFKRHNKGIQESHVDRAMNVWGSGGAHGAYFKKLDQVVKDLFNKPLEEQPKGILDMGCGNGAFLIHLFDIIEKETLRGKHLDNYPLFLVGVDYNDAAISVTRKNLIQADIWAKVIWGDIGNPKKLEQDLWDNYEINLADLLNVRTFLDHNRPWFSPSTTLHYKTKSTGAFAHEGKRLNNQEVVENLKEHLLKWKPYLHKYGLLMIELHTINPELTANNLGFTAATAYDATHGFSDQYILEIDEFNSVIEEIGLLSHKDYFSKFPNSNLATVSVQYLIDKLI